MRYIWVLAMLACLMTGCRQKSVITGLESVDAETFQTQITAGKVQLLDVRTAKEYVGAHIEGSVNVDVMDDQFATSVEELLDKQRTVYLYCRSGRRSKKAANLLVEKGYKVVELATGINGWQKAGYPVK